MRPIASPSWPTKPSIPARSVEDYLADMRLFLFDTALCAGPAAMPSLLAFAAPGNILFGSDFPFASRPVGTSFTRKLDAYVASDAALATSINRGAALNLFPRLA
jgi:6-methylsalicylate decarboxylase